jgi:hypothetical protein
MWQLASDATNASSGSTPDADGLIWLHDIHKQSARRVRPEDAIVEKYLYVAFRWRNNCTSVGFASRSADANVRFAWSKNLSKTA